MVNQEGGLTLKFAEDTALSKEEFWKLGGAKVDGISEMKGEGMSSIDYNQVTILCSSVLTTKSINFKLSKKNQLLKSLFFHLFIHMLMHFFVESTNTI